MFVASESDDAVVTLEKLKDGTLKILSVVNSEGGRRLASLMVLQVLLLQWQ